MQSLTFVLLLALLQAPGTQSRPQQAETQKPAEAAAKPAEQEKAEKEPPEEKPTVTTHEMKIAERSLKYTVTTGMMPLKNEKGDTEARIFFIGFGLGMLVTILIL
jgi:carboxypeptidase C (cathepsin A)